MLARRRKRKKEEEAKAKIAEEEAAMPRHKLTFKAAATAVIVQHKLRKRVLFGYNLDIFDQLPRLVKLPSRSTSERLTTRTPSEPIHRGLGKLFGGGGSGGGDRPTGGVASRPRDSVLFSGKSSAVAAWSAPEGQQGLHARGAVAANCCHSSADRGRRRLWLWCDRVQRRAVGQCRSLGAVSILWSPPLQLPLLLCRRDFPTLDSTIANTAI